MQKLYKPSYGGGKEIYLGEINNGMYSRRVRTQHIYKYKNFETGEVIEGWTVDKDACEQTIFSECSYMNIKNSDTDKMFVSSIKGFMENAVPLRDRYFLALEHWEEVDDRKAFKRVEVIKRDI